MFLDRVLNNAAAINPTAGSLSISDSVSTANPVDVYKFTLQQRSSLNLLASGLSGDVNIAVVQDKVSTGVGIGVVNDGEVLFQSVNAGLTPESLKVSTLEPGTYYVVVELGANPTAANYTIEAGATKATNADILWRDFTNRQVGYWRFDGLQYLDTRTVVTAMDAGWQFEAIGDFDGDRADDILWRHSSTNELVVWLLDPETATIKSGSGYIKQTATQNYMIPQSFRVAGVGDTNGDGKGDIIWRNESAQTTVVWYMNGSQFIDGGAVRLAGQTGPLLNDASWELVDTTRINDDAKFDIVWRNRTSNQVVNWIMDGNVITSGGTTAQRLGAAYDIESVGDFNGDGRGDLLWRDTQGNVQMWLVNAQYNNYDIQTLKLQSTGAAWPVVGIEYKLVGVEDFSGDGKSDIVWRHQTSGALVLWNMDGATITQQSQSVSNTEVTNLSRQTLGTASKADFVDLTGVRLAIGSDSGESPNDWITNVRNPGISGVTDAGNQVSLFANNRLIGQTTAATTGIWSIVSSALDDGVYNLSTQVKTTTGGTITQNVARKLTIDGTTPELTTSGLVDGVAWTPQDQLKAILKDIDPKAKVEYQITNGQLQFSAVLDATLTNIDGTAKTGNLALKTLSELGFVAATDGSLSKRTEIALKVTDRAGNIQTQTLKGVVLNLSDLTDESYLSARSNSGSTSGGTADSKTPLAGTWVPQATVGTTPNQALYIGPSGAWGYAQAGTGTGAGGNGIAVGTIGWVPASLYNPGGTGSTGGTATPPLPPLPTLPSTIPDLLDYVPALEVIFKTAIDVLSNAGATAAKKLVLNNAQSQLLSTGRVVQQYNLYDVMQPLLNGVYKSAYVSGGKLAKATAVQLGWSLAKALAASNVSTKLQSFEAPLLAATYGAVKSNGGTVATTVQSSLLTTVRSLAKSYATLNPADEHSSPSSDIQETGKIAKGTLDRLWNWYNFEDGYTNTGSLTPTDTISYLKAQLAGQPDVVKALQFVDRMIQAATRVETLHQGVNGYANPAGYAAYPTYIKYGGFLRELTELGFEIARVNPTTTAGVNPSDEWIENLIEENGTGAGIKLASVGVSQLFNGLQLNQGGSAAGMTQVGRALDLSEKALMAIEKIPSYQNIFHDPIFLQTEIEFAKNHVLLSPYETSSIAEGDRFLNDVYLASLSGDNNKINQAAATRESKLNTETVSLSQYRPISWLETYGSYAEAQLALNPSTQVAGSAGLVAPTVPDIKISDADWKVSRATYTETLKVKLVSQSPGFVSVQFIDPKTGNPIATAFGGTTAENDVASLVLGRIHALRPTYNDDPNYYQILIRRSNGKIDVYDSDAPVSIRDGDAIFLPKITPSEASVLRQELLALSDPTKVKALEATWRGIADFVRGAIYEYLKDVSVSSLTEIANLLFPPFAQQNQATIELFEEAYLPKSNFFRAGRAVGAGGAIIQGLWEIVAGIKQLSQGLPGLAGATAVGGPLGSAVGTGAVLGSALAVIHGSATVSAGVKSLPGFLDDLRDLYERSKSNKAIENGKAPDGKKLTPTELAVSEEISQLKAERHAELKQVRREIKDLKDKGTPPDNEEILELRYRKYLMENVDTAKRPYSPEEWIKSEGIARQNRGVGEIAQENVLKELGLADNNKAGNRISNTVEGLGSTIPDAVTSKAWIDVKSVNTKDGVMSRTSQLHLQEISAKAEGKRSVVIMTGSNPVRPTKPLAANSRVLQFNESTKTWQSWDNVTERWSQSSLEAVRSLLGN
jgi:hypothetical protein